MGLSIAKFPFVGTLEGFHQNAQPAVDSKQIRELALGRAIVNGEKSFAPRPTGRGQDAFGRGAYLGGDPARLLHAVRARERTRHQPRLGSLRRTIGRLAPSLQ